MPTKHLKHKILVTGGAGFIGSHIARTFLENGHHVWVVDNLQTGQLSNIASCQDHPSFRFDQVDICHWPLLEEAVLWADRIYHMAATVGQRIVLANPINTLLNNMDSCGDILKAMVKTGSQARILIASTSEVYRHTPLKSNEGYSENSILSFTSGECIQESYPIAKLATEIMGLSYFHEKGIHCTIARIFNTIGLNQCAFYGMVLPSFIEQALQKKPITVYGTGLQTRSFVNVKDVVHAFDLILENPESRGEIINVGNDHETSILDLAKLVKELTGSSSEIVFVPYKEAYGVDFNDPQRRKPNISKMIQLTGFSPQYTLRETIEEICESLCDRVR